MKPSTIAEGTVSGYKMRIGTIQKRSSPNAILGLP